MLLVYLFECYDFYVVIVFSILKERFWFSGEFYRFVIFLRFIK